MLRVRVFATKQEFGTGIGKGIGKSNVLLLGDNESSLKPSMNPVFHQRSKHIGIKYHPLWDRVEEGLLELCNVDTGLNTANMLTKNAGVGVLKVCEGLSGMVTSGLWILVMDVVRRDCEMCCNITYKLKSTVFLGG